ncbi:MAG: CbiX/SirB N-terminal domain-containing protein [Terriglobales bacterium]|jgi:sirohydrochlorin cobaltochelatase
MRELDPLTFLVAESLFRGDLKKRPKAAKTSAGRRARKIVSDENVCLLLLAHGSKDPRWCAPFERISLELQKELGPSRVRLAYMEFMRPNLVDVVYECVQQRTLNLRLLPLFMAVGAHLASDIPEQVADVRRQFPEISLEILPPVGEDARMMQLVEQIAIEAATE